jgi:hypothetical protein
MVPWAVRISTGSSGWRRCTASNSCRPSMPPMRRSVISSCGSSWSSTPSAASPLAASTTSWPSARRRIDSSRSRAGSSSTIRMRAMGGCFRGGQKTFARDARAGQRRDRRHRAVHDAHADSLHAGRILNARKLVDFLGQVNARPGLGLLQRTVAGVEVGGKAGEVARQLLPEIGRQRGRCQLENGQHAAQRLQPRTGGRLYLPLARQRRERRVGLIRAGPVHDDLPGLAVLGRGPGWCGRKRRRGRYRHRH